MQWKFVLGVPMMAVTVLLLVACSDTPIEEVTPAAGVSNVIVEDNQFGPRAISVPAGTQVTWDFQDNHDHDVVGDGFASERMTTGIFTHTFTAPGTYDYRCTLHSNMTGRVVVTP